MMAFRLLRRQLLFEVVRGHMIRFIVTVLSLVPNAMIDAQVLHAMAGLPRFRVTTAGRTAGVHIAVGLLANNADWHFLLKVYMRQSFKPFSGQTQIENDTLFLPKRTSPAYNKTIVFRSWGRSIG